MYKPIAESCLRNQAAIADTLTPLLQARQSSKHKLRLLEIGSGTGQHGAYCASKMPDVIWQMSDLPDCMEGMLAWQKEAKCPNLPVPLVLNMQDEDWHLTGRYDAVFTANTVHFVGENKVENMIRQVGELLTTGGLFCIYGPFNQNGAYTSEGNQRLDVWLKGRDPESGIKDIAWVINECRQHKLLYRESVLMPANNQVLVFDKV